MHGEMGRGVVKWPDLCRYLWRTACSCDVFPKSQHLPSTTRVYLSSNNLWPFVLLP